MKRPIIVLVLIWGIGLLIWLRAMSLIMVVLVLSYFLYGSKIHRIKLRHLLMIVSLCFFSMLRIMWYDISYENEVAYLIDQEQVEVQGVIHSIKALGSSYEYTLVDWSDSRHKAGDFSLKVKSATKWQVGDHIVVQGRIEPLESMRNEGGFDYAGYCKQVGVSARIKGSSSLIKSKEAYHLKRLLYEQRIKHYSVIQTLLPYDHASIIGTLLLGLDTVEENIEEAFRHSGLIHILAISGLHVSIITLGCFGLLRRISTVKNAAVVTLIFGLVYCIYTGGHTSTVRATLMVSLYLMQYVVVRRYDPTTSLSLAGLILLAINPYEVMNAGFVLSFSAVAALFYITPALKRDVVKSEGYIWDQLRTIMAIQIGLLPVLAFYFHTISIYSIVANVLVLPIVSLIIVFSVLTIVLAYIWVPLAAVIAGIVFWLLNYTMLVVEVISHLPYSQVTVGTISVLSLALYALALILWMVSSRKYLQMMVLGTLILSITFNSYIEYKQLVIRHMDVGQGDGAIITYRDRCLLIDGGGVIGKDMTKNTGAYVLLPFFQSKGIKEIDTVFVSHSDYDHIYGIIEIAQSIPIHRLVFSEYELQNLERPMLKRLLDTVSEDTEIIYMAAGESLSYDDLSIECLSPYSDRRYEDVNDASMVLMVMYGDFQALFLGDVSMEQELGVLPSVQKVLSPIELVKVAHHGSDSSTLPEFYEAVQPMISVISVGKNTYGQPATDVLSTLDKYSNQVLTTLDHGEVIIRTDGKSMNVTTMID